MQDYSVTQLRVSVQLNLNTNLYSIFRKTCFFVSSNYSLNIILTSTVIDLFSLNLTQIKK